MLHLDYPVVYVLISPIKPNFRVSHGKKVILKINLCLMFIELTHYSKQSRHMIKN